MAASDPTVLSEWNPTPQISCLDCPCRDADFRSLAFPGWMHHDASPPILLTRPEVAYVPMSTRAVVRGLCPGNSGG